MKKRLGFSGKMDKNGTLMKRAYIKKENGVFDLITGKMKEKNIYDTGFSKKMGKK